MSAGGPVWALGAMSGTSLDGVDAAMILTDGERVLEFGETAYRPYSNVERDVLRAALGKWDGPDVETAAEVVEDVHAEVLARFRGAEVVGFHGQTTSHRPHVRQTHQAGNGEVLAEALGVPVVWDFRSTDVEMGGQGAPLASFYHYALARRAGLKKPLAVLNLGGVGNVTWLDPRFGEPEAPGACLAFDTGPANAKMDDLMQVRMGQRFDDGGALAASGAVVSEVLDQLMEGEGFFAIVPPKSLDRDDFQNWLPAVADLRTEDALATLAAATAGSVARGFEHFAEPPNALWVTGGGRHNAELMRMIEALVPCPVVAIEEVGYNGDMLEAQAFAYLAVRVMRGLPTSAPGTTRVPAPVGGGRISRPGDLSF